MIAKKATHQLTRQHNRDLVLRTIFEKETISRAGIARLTQLTRTTVSDVVAGLLAEGLVYEVGPGSSINGKPSILLSIIPDSRYLVGLSLEQHKFYGAVVNLRGEVKEAVEEPVQGRDGKQALSLLYQMLDQLVSKNWAPIVGIGVGTPGLINTREGIVVRAVNLDWQDLPLARLLQERYPIPVSILNDSQATAIGEFVYGDHGAEDNLIVINVKRGIGAGILIHGRLFQGDGGGAGEIGHVVVEENGLLCRCGRRGCLETVASVQAVLQRTAECRQALSTHSHAGDLAAEPLSLEALVEDFYRGEPSTREVVLQAGSALGISIANLVGVLNIHKVVLTGDMTRFGADWLAAVDSAMRRSALARMTQETRLELGRLGVRACILGASAYQLLGGYSLLFNSVENGRNVG